MSDGEESDVEEESVSFTRESKKKPRHIVSGLCFEHSKNNYFTSVILMDSTLICFEAESEVRRAI